MIIVTTLLQENALIVYLSDYCKRTLIDSNWCAVTFLTGKIVMMNIYFALRAISSVPVVGTEQKCYQNDCKPIAMLIEFFVGEFRRLRC